MVTGPVAAALKPEEPESLRRLKAAMAPVKFKVAISGTARGAGVSTVAANLALTLAQAQEGHARTLQASARFGILDLGTGSKPALEPWGIKVLSLEKLLGRHVSLESGSPEEWRAVQECLAGVDWRGFDFLLVELPIGVERVGDLSDVLPGLDAAFIVTLPTEGARDRIRGVWKFLDASSVPVIGLVSNMEERFEGEGVEDLGQTFGIPLRMGIPYVPTLATAQAGAAPHVLANTDAGVSRAFFDLSDDLVDYLFWLRDEHDQEEEF